MAIANVTPIIGHVICTKGKFEATLLGSADRKRAAMVIRAWAGPLFDGAAFELITKNGCGEVNIEQIAALFDVELSQATKKRLAKRVGMPIERAPEQQAAGQTIEVAESEIVTQLEPVVAQPTATKGPKGVRVCSIASCTELTHAKGLCPVHYREERKVKRAA